MSKREGRRGAAGCLRARQRRQTEAGFVLVREMKKKISGEVPTSMNDDLSD